MKRTIEPQELEELLRDNKDVVLIDVRRRADYEADKAMIPGAIWRDPEEKEHWSGDLPKDKDVVIYCVKGGSVSNSVLDYLRDKNVSARYVEGGIKAWQGAGGEVTG